MIESEEELQRALSKKKKEKKKKHHHRELFGVQRISHIIATTQQTETLKSIFVVVVMFMIRRIRFLCFGV